jgi:hypothetical protein
MADNNAGQGLRKHLVGQDMWAWEAKLVGYDTLTCVPPMTPSKPNITYGHHIAGTVTSPNKEKGVCGERRDER